MHGQIYCIFVLPLFNNFYKSTSISSQTFRTSGFSASSLQSCSHFWFKTVLWDSCSLVFSLPLKIPNNCFLQILWQWWFRTSFVLSASAVLLGLRTADCQSLLHNSVFPHGISSPVLPSKSGACHCFPMRHTSSQLCSTFEASTQLAPQFRLSWEGSTMGWGISYS